MRKIQVTLIAMLACIFSATLCSCGDDEEDTPDTSNVTVTLSQTSLTTYQPSGMLSIPVRLSDSSAQLTASDVQVALTSQTSVGSVLTYPTIALKSVEKGSEAGSWNIMLEMNLNNLERSTMGITVTCFGKVAGSVTVSAYRAHRLDRQVIEPEGSCTFSIDSLLTVEEATLSLNRIAYGEIKDDGSFQLTDAPEEFYSIGTVGSNRLTLIDFGYLTNGKNYSFIVRLQRTEDVTDDYVWFELPVACKEAE